MATEQLQLEEKKAFPLGMARRERRVSTSRGSERMCVRGKRLRAGGRENERLGDVCVCARLRLRARKGACLSVCVLQIARKQARETKQASEIEREGKVCVCAARDRRCFACVSAANEK